MFSLGIIPAASDNCMAGAVLLRKQYAPSDESGGRTAPHKPGHPPFVVLLLGVSAEGAPLVAFLGGLDGVSELADLQRERPRVQWARADIPDLVRATFGYGHGEGCVPGRTARPNGRNTRRQTPTCDEQVKTELLPDGPSWVDNVRRPARRGRRRERSTCTAAADAGAASPNSRPSQDDD